jgi:hypothetical protein
VTKTYFEQYISTFIDSQFPGFYQDEGPNFVAFVKAYYEWLERTDKYTINYNPKANVSFTVGQSVINLTNTAQQGLIVAVSDNAIEILGKLDLEQGTQFSQIETIDQTTSGTLSFTKNSRIVIGTGTSFLTDFAVGEYIYASEHAYKISAISDDFTITVEEQSIATVSGIPFVRYILSVPASVITVYNTPNPIAYARRLADDSDIDSSLPQFVQYFKTKYMNAMPNEMLADKRFLTKHILDLYRSKGSQRSYELLFRIMFNEDVTIFLPSQHLFAPSEANWFVPTYIEISDTEFLNDFINKEIYSSSKDAKATVEYVFRKNVSGRIISGMLISNIRGTFHYGDYVLSEELDDVTVDNAPRITGSLSTVSITNGGSGFSVGDILDIRGTGVGGKAVVSSVINESGKANFFLKSGGSGYTMNASVIIDSTNTGGTGASFLVGDLTNKEIIQVSSDILSTYFNTQIDNVANTFTVQVTGKVGNYTVGEYVKSTANVIPLDVSLISGSPTINETVSNGTVSATLRNFDINFAEVTGNTANLVAGTSTFTGGTSGATFSINTVFTTKVVECNAYVSAVVGSNLTLNNCYSYSAANKVVLSIAVSAAGNNYANGDLVTFTGGGGTDATAIISTNNNGGIVTADVRCFGTNYTSTPTPVINTAAGSGGVLSTTVGYLAGYPYPGVTLTGQSSAATGTTSVVTRLTNWGFPAISIPDIENLDTIIGASLTYQSLEIGTIRYITAINPGNDYVLPPKVTVVEPSIAILAIDDGSGGTKGNNAIVTATAGDATGVVTSIKILDSGFGYQPDETLELTDATNNQAITADSVISQHGVSAGYWKNRKSFPSDTMYIQDSYYWQRFSYDIQASRMLDTYKNYVKDLIHPAGFAMFGTFKKTSDVSEASILEESSLTQS